MNAMMNQTLICYCEICDKTIIFKSETKYINSKSLKYNRNMVSLLKSMDSINQKLME